MTIKPRNREPTHPGKILRKIIEETEGLSQEKVAQKMGVGVQVVSKIVNGRTSITPETAFKLGQVFDMTPQFWLNMQNSLDLWKIANRPLAQHA